MRDVLSPRLKLGVLIPSTNTVVEPEYHRLAPEGVTVHAGRLHIRRPRTDADATFGELIDDVRADLDRAASALATCEPDRIALGMTAIAFLGGRAAERELQEQIEEVAGVPVITGPHAMVSALRAAGHHRIVLLSPYQPMPERSTVQYFEEAGIEVCATASLRSPSATSIAKVTADEVEKLVRDSNRDEADAIVQVGTNLAMAHLTVGLGRDVGKPVLAINEVTLAACLAAHPYSADDADERATGPSVRRP